MTVALVIDPAAPATVPEQEDVEDGSAVPAGPGDATRPRWAPMVSTLVGGALCLKGLLIGLEPLHDNSFVTHLATGRLILATHHVPTADPYSFTYPGRAWVVQSWFASVLYASAEKLGGLGAVRLLIALSTLLLTAAIWRLTAPARTLVPRAAIAVLALVVGSGTWVERPLLFGLLGMAAVLLAAEERLDPRWLVPIMWVWVNTHGSFPLALVVVGALAVGRRLDGHRPTAELRALLWTGVGILAGAINPLGPRLLLFPAQLLQHSENFRAVVEWKPPTWQTTAQQVFLAQLVLAGLLLLRRRSWRVALPTVFVAVLAATSARNVVVASLVLVPLMAEAARDLGSLRGDARPAIGRAVLAVLVALGLVLTVTQLQQPDTNLSAYPTGALAWMAQHDLVGNGTTRVVSRDFVGNLLEARYGTKAHVYIDDRVDMYPYSLISDYTTLRRGLPGWQAALARARAQVVLWDQASPLAGLLEHSPAWQVVHRQDGWIVAVPRTS